MGMGLMGIMGLHHKSKFPAPSIISQYKIHQTINHKSSHFLIHIMSLPIKKNIRVKN
jgi:hypothetical protein